MSEEKILLGHGSGGKLTQELIKNFFLKEFDNKILRQLKDSAIIKSLAITVDSYVVNPIFFPGGDIGKLAVCGTINDLAVVGAKPLYLTCSFIMEESLPLSWLKKIIVSMKKTAKEAKVQIVAGDTKVVEKGKADKLFITTSGVGVIKKPLDFQVKPGDKIIVSGTIGDHGIAVISQREGLSFESRIKSDCAALNKLVEDILSAGKIHWMRDPTRGGLATTLNELANEYKIGIKIYEDKIPLLKEVEAACEMLGFDPLYVANEGKLVAVVSENDAEKILKVMHKNKQGKKAEIIGEVISEYKGKVFLKTKIGGTRIVDILTAEQLPRIC